MTLRRLLPTFLIILIAAIFLEGCGRLTEISEQRFVMHTYIEIKIADKNMMLAQDAMDEAFKVFSDYEKKYNFYIGVHLRHSKFSFKAREILGSINS